MTRFISGLHALETLSCAISWFIRTAMCYLSILVLSSYHFNGLVIFWIFFVCVSAHHTSTCYLASLLVPNSCILLYFLYILWPTVVFWFMCLLEMLGTLSFLFIFFLFYLLSSTWFLLFLVAMTLVPRHDRFLYARVIPTNTFYSPWSFFVSISLLMFICLCLFRIYFINPHFSFAFLVTINEKFPFILCSLSLAENL